MHPSHNVYLQFHCDLFTIGKWPIEKTMWLLTDQKDLEDDTWNSLVQIRLAPQNHEQMNQGGISNSLKARNYHLTPELP